MWANLSCTVAVAYHFCMENRLSKILFSNPFPKNAEVVNLKNPDLDLIRSIRFGFKNPFSDFPKKPHP